jgi:hypothetical protein
VSDKLAELTLGKKLSSSNLLVVCVYLVGGLMQKEKDLNLDSEMFSLGDIAGDEEC